MFSRILCSFSAQIAVRKQQWFSKALLALLSLSTARVWSARYKQLFYMIISDIDKIVKWHFFFFFSPCKCVLTVFPKKANKPKKQTIVVFVLTPVRGDTKFNTLSGFILEVAMTVWSPTLKVTTDKKHSNRHLLIVFVLFRAALKHILYLSKLTNLLTKASC